MDRVTWTEDAQPRELTLGKLLYNLRTDASGDPDLLLDAVTMDDLMQDPDIEQILMLDALVVEVGMMQRKMEQLMAVMTAAGKTVQPTGMEIGEPVRSRGVLQVPVLFPMSDGQTVAVWFHNPDATPAKLTPMDMLTSWRWMVNKKDVTIAAAPERGADLQPRIVARRVMAIVEKNSPAFTRANAKAAEKAGQIEALKGEVGALEVRKAGLKRDVEIAREESLARGMAKAKNLDAPTGRTVDTGNNESYFVGVSPNADGTFTAMTASTSKTFKSLAGANRWMENRAQPTPADVQTAEPDQALAVPSDQPAAEPPTAPEPAPDWKSMQVPDLMTAEQYAMVYGVPEAEAYWQDALDHQFVQRIIDTRNAARALGWVAEGFEWPMVNADGAKLDMDTRDAGVGKNIVGVTYQVSVGGEGVAAVRDDLSMSPADLAAEITARAPVKAADPAPLKPLPPRISSRVTQAIESLNDAKSQLDTARTGLDENPKIGGGGRYESEVWQKVQGQVAKANDDLQKLRELGNQNGQIASLEALITSLGGVPDVKPSEKALAWTTSPAPVAPADASSPSGQPGTDMFGDPAAPATMSFSDYLKSGRLQDAIELLHSMKKEDLIKTLFDAGFSPLLGAKTADAVLADRYLSKQIFEAAEKRVDGFGLGELKGEKPLFGDAPQAFQTQPVALTPEGTESKVKTAKGTEVLTGYSVVEADHLITSHNPSTGDANPAFPAELQPRDRGRDASIAWVKKTAQNLDPDLLGKSRRADSGAPIVGPDGVVESGNGRTMAVVLAYQTGKADNYRAWLEEEAGYFGLKPEKVKAMKRPVLVRIRTSKVDRAAFAIEANQSDTLAMTATEKAKSDARRMDDSMIALMTENGDLAAAENVPFLSAFLRSLGESEAAQYSTTDGKPTSTLIARVQAAIFAKAYADDRLLELTADVAKPEIANIVKALNHAAPEFIQAAAMDPDATSAATGKLTDAVEKSLNQKAVDALLGASNVIRSAKDAGQSVDEFVSQAGLFGDIDPDVAAMAVFISKNNRSAKRMGEAFRAMAVFIKGELQRRQTADMFGDGEPVDFKDIVAAANRELERMYGPGVETIGLFDRPGGNPAEVDGPAPAGSVAAAPDPYSDWMDKLVAIVANDRGIDASDVRKEIASSPDADRRDAAMRGQFNAGYEPGTVAALSFGVDPTKGLTRGPRDPDQEPDFDPVAAVNAAYTFDTATDDFKAELAQSLNDEDYSPFATAREFDQAVKSHGGTVSWALVPGAILDSAAAHGTADDEDDWGDVSDDWDDAAGELVTDGVLILDGDFAGHPFRGNQFGRAKMQTHHAARASREAKRADRRAAGHDRVLQYAHSSAAHAHKQAAKGSAGKTKAYHAKMAAFHSKRAQHHQDKIDGKPVMDSIGTDLLLDSAWPDADMVILDSAGGDIQGVIRKGARVLGRAVIGGDGKGMIYTGAKGSTRVTNPSGARAVWGEYPSVMVEGLFGAAPAPKKSTVKSQPMDEPMNQTTAPEAATMPAIDADRAYLRAIIDKKIAITDDVMARVEAMAATHASHAEMMALIEESVDVIQAVVIAQAQSAMGGKG